MEIDYKEFTSDELQIIGQLEDILDSLSDEKITLVFEAVKQRMIQNQNHE